MSSLLRTGDSVAGVTEMTAGFNEVIPTGHPGGRAKSFRLRRRRVPTSGTEIDNVNAMVTLGSSVPESKPSIVHKI